MSNFIIEKEYLEGKNIHLGNAVGFIEDGTNKNHAGATIPSNYARIAQDAELVTQANSTVPTALLSYWDPKAIEVLLAPRSAGEIYPIVKKGDFASEQINFQVEEMTGGTVPYSDYGHSGQASTNYNWPRRDVYRFQTNITVGDLEAERAGAAKISLVSRRQKSAATIIAIDANKFFLYGVSGLQIFGILNDPNLLPAIAPLPNAGGDTQWDDKSPQEIFGDVIELFKELVEQLKGRVDQNSAITLSISPGLRIKLGAANEYNMSAQTMIDKYFKKMTIVSVPELTAVSGSNTMQMKVDEVEGQRTGECLEPEKFRALPVFRKESYITQKVAAATSGGVIYRPVGVATMTGM